MVTIRIRCLAVAWTLGLTGIAGAEWLQIVDNLPGEFTDISEIGEPLNLGDDEVKAIESTVGNDVFDAGQWWVGNNGGIGFGLSDLLPPVQDPIPSDNIFEGGQATLPFGDDTGSDEGNVFWSVYRDVLIVQWHNRPFVGSSDTGRFQVKIFSDPGPNQIYAQFIYADIEQPWPNGGEIATIGYQNGDAGFNDVQWSYHVAGAVSNGMVLSLIPEPSTAALSLLGAIPWLRRR